MGKHFPLSLLTPYLLSSQWQIEDIHTRLWRGASNVATWHIGCQKSIKGVHVVLLYNGSTHFTGTGYILYWDTCNTFYTVLIN